jgi:hypothetical protein
MFALAACGGGEPESTAPEPSENYCNRIEEGALAAEFGFSGETISRQVDGMDTTCIVTFEDSPLTFRILVAETPSAENATSRWNDALDAATEPEETTGDWDLGYWAQTDGDLEFVFTEDNLYGVVLIPDGDFDEHWFGLFEAASQITS